MKKYMFISLSATCTTFIFCLLMLSCTTVSTLKSNKMSNTTNHNKVLLVGIDPKKLDYTKLTNVTEEKLSTALENEKQKLISEGYDAKWCLIDLGATAEKTLQDELTTNTYDLILVGAGIRTLPENFQMFENVINVIHAHAPKSKICFNTSAFDSELAVKRWLKLK